MGIEKELAAYLRDARPFAWDGETCCTFASRWVAAHGGDPLAGVDLPTTEREAWRRLKALGGLHAAITQQLGRQPIPPALAQVGDIVATERSVGICNGRTAAVMAANGSIGFLPMTAMVSAWRLQCA